MKLWAREIIKLLNNSSKLHLYSKNASKFVKKFDSSVAAEKMIMAIKYAQKN